MDIIAWRLDAGCLILDTRFWIIGRVGLSSNQYRESSIQYHFHS